MSSDDCRRRRRCLDGRVDHQHPDAVDTETIERRLHVGSRKSRAFAPDHGDDPLLRTGSGARLTIVPHRRGGPRRRARRLPAQERPELGHTAPGVELERPSVMTALQVGAGRAGPAQWLGRMYNVSRRRAMAPRRRALLGRAVISRNSGRSRCALRAGARRSPACDERRRSSTARD